MGYLLGALWKENINPAEVMSTEAICGERGGRRRRRECEPLQLWTVRDGKN